MGRANLIQTNFTGGELSPRMLGRVDVARYNSGLKRAENVLIMVHGGAMRRHGLQFVAPTKHHDKASRLIPYVFNVEQAYQLEFGDFYMRVYLDDGAQVEASPGVPYEIATPYSAAQIAEIDFIQGADTMFLFHPAVPIQRLQRFGHADWRLQDAPFTTQPFAELGTRPAATLTLSATTVGTGRALTTDVAAFVPGDFGRVLSAGGGTATITAINTSTSVEATITAPFSSATHAPGAWLLEGSPQATVSPASTGPVGASITMNLSVEAFRPADIGRFLVINGGLIQLTSQAPTSATGIVRAELAANASAPPDAWALCRSMWGQEFGWPRTGSLHQQRLWAAGSPGFPQSAWMSVLGDPYDFEIGTQADAGYEVRIASDQANPIRHLASTRSLAVLTYGGEFTITADGAYTPTSLSVQNQSAFGSALPAPVRIGNELMFVSPAIDEETGNRRDEIRAMSADRFDNSNYAAPNITALAEHVTESGLVDLDGAKDLLFAPRADGQMVALRVDRDNDVVAASRFITDGAFESVSFIPKDGIWECWAVVRRTVGGATKRYVERFVPGLYMDSAVRGSVGGAGAAVWAGLGHLEGKTVAVRADGVVQASQVVTGGQITLPRAANMVDIGLPFTPLIELMTPEIVGPSGSAQGRMMRTNEVTVIVKDTVGARVNGRDIAFRNFGSNTLDVPPAPASGPQRIELLGFARGESDLVIEQPSANPFHVLAVVRQVTVN